MVVGNRTNICSGAPWEKIVGYCRAVRIGNQIEVAGTTAVDEGQVVGPNDPEAQTRFILGRIQSALEDLGASLNDVIRTRIFVTDISGWEPIGKVHGEFFENIQPVATMVEVSRLIQPELMVEIEATAIVGESDES